LILDTGAGSEVNTMEMYSDPASAYAPHGAALLDFFCGHTSATLICHQDGERDDVPAAFWFREVMDPLEAHALDLCCGSVLDVGAGAGVHALEIQRRGLAVSAIDVAPECIAIMQERGVRDARVADLYQLDDGRYDTIICLCNGFDKVGRLSDMPRFLACMRRLLVPGGQLIADSFDLRVGASRERLDRMSRKEASGTYFGEMTLSLEYGGLRAAEFSVLHVDSETLCRIADREHWSSEILQRRGGHYLVRLRPRPLPG
jgi:SAM-dependent methyltransferase